MRMVIIFCSGAVMAREDSRRVINSLIQMKVPYVFCFSLFAALRFIPLFGEAFAQALTALQLRGVDLRRVPWRQKLRLYSALLVPVLAETLARAENLARSWKPGFWCSAPANHLCKEHNERAGLGGRGCAAACGRLCCAVLLCILKELWA